MVRFIEAGLTGASGGVHRNTMYDTGIYTASAGKRNKMISNSILSAMNNDISKVQLMKLGAIWRDK